MNDHSNANKKDRVPVARESFSGRLLTDRQFDEAIAITTIIEQEIRQSGTFKDKLGDYSYAFARTEKFDTVKAEAIIRDLFKERTGQSMNQMREDMAKREEAVTDTQRAEAYARACAIGELMADSPKMSFHRAFTHQARQLGEAMGVTDACARRLMREEFAAAEGSELQAWGKELDETIYRPQIEAEKSERAARATPQKARSARPAFRRAGPQ
ncbi:hypothetical protein [Xanthobacter autotrophicus]|uniref:hypothetical protein n=1 Tax=Xanthobacter autotrophicus TaxID=280 RepID=UPI003727F79A